MNENTMQIITCLLSTNNYTGSVIHRETGIAISVISKHLHALQLTGIADYKVCVPHTGRGYTGKCWHLINAPDVFETLLNAFIDTDQMKYFVESKYARTILDDYPEKCNQILISTILNKLDEIQPICAKYYPNTPISDALKSLRASVTNLEVD